MCSVPSKHSDWGFSLDAASHNFVHIKRHIHSTETSSSDMTLYIESLQHNRFRQLILNYCQELLHRHSLQIYRHFQDASETVRCIIVLLLSELH